MLHRIITALGVILASMFVLVTPASAQTSVLIDPYQDVARWSDDAVTDGTQSGIDIRKMRVKFTNDHLQIRTFHWDLTKGNAWDRMRFFIMVNRVTEVPTYTITNNGQEFYFQRTKTWWQVDHIAASREVPCGIKLRIRPDLDTVLLRIPRQCLGDHANRVREGLLIEDSRARSTVYDSISSRGTWTYRG